MFLALRDLRSARGRFGLVAAVVALLSFLVVALTGLTAGLAKESVGALEALPADHVALAEPTDGGSATFDTSALTASQVTAVSRQRGVTEASLLGVTTSRLGDKPVAVFAADPGASVAPDALRDGGVVVSDTLDTAVGDTVTLGGASYEVAATTHDSSFNHLPVVWTTRTAWKAMPGHGDAAATAVALTTDSTYDPASAPPGTTVTTLDDARDAAGSYAAENGSLTMIRVLLLGVSALVVGAFFTVWTIQRTPDLAVLKAMGADTAYLVRDALAQAAIVLVVGGGIGTALGAAVGGLASSVVPFVVSPATAVVPLVLLLALGLVGAAASLRRIATVDPLVALGAAR